MILHYKKSGTGPVVVLIHGFLLSSDYWYEVQKSLENSYTVISIDLLGFGRSPKPLDSQYTLKEQVEALHATLRHLDVSSCILVGHSMGGVVAAQYAVTYPQSVTRLFLYMPPLFTSPTQAYHSISQTNTLYRFGLYSPYGRLLWLPVRGIMHIAPYAITAPYRHIATALRHSTHSSRTLSQRHIIEGSPLFPILEHLTVPTTLYVGKKDRKIYQNNLAHNATVLSHINVQLLDAGHHFIVKNPTHLRKVLM